MLQRILEALVRMAKFFLPAFVNKPIVPTPEPIPPTSTAPAPVLPPSATGPMWHPEKGGNSHWWIGKYPITQAYGCTDFATEGHNPYHPECAYFHEGVDFGLPCGTDVFSGGHFLVVAIDPPGYGPPGHSAAIQLREGDRDVWLYHMHDYVVKAGDHVHAGHLIGHSGTRGYSTGCHIHFEVRPAGAPYRHSINPMPYLM